MMHRGISLAVGIVLGATTAARADDGAGVADDDSASASDYALRMRELGSRLHDGATDLLRELPGLFLVQSAGGGVADQLTLRGFDGATATDVSVIVDGVPINLPSHVGGNGYADTHFLIAPTVAALDLRKGPQAQRGFGTGMAGELNLTTLDRVPGKGVYVAVRSGTVASDTTQLRQRVRRLMHRAIAMTSPQLSRGDAIIAAEVGITDGFTANPQRLRRSVLLAKWRYPTSSGTLRVAANLYAARWAESGMVPAAEVADDALGRFDSIDPTQGGTTNRASLSVGFATPEQRAEVWRVQAFAVASDWQHFENRTLFLRNAAEGDQNQLIDSRHTFGMNADYRRASGVAGNAGARQLHVGVDMRSDDGTLERWRTVRQTKTVDCFAALNPCQTTEPTVITMGLYGSHQIDWTAALRTRIGLRVDQFTWNIDDRDPESATNRTTIGGSSSRARLSPSLHVRLRRGAAAWLINAQGGARSTDAHAAVISDAYASVVRLWAADAGVRVRPNQRLEAAATAWYTYIEAQQTWDATALRVVLAPAATRIGADTWIKFAPVPWLRADAALSVAPPAALNTPRFLASAGVAVDFAHTMVALRARGVARQGSAGYALLSAVAGHQWRRWNVEVSVDNLLDSAWTEAELIGPYRATRTGEAGLGRMFTPGAPRTVLATVGVTL